MKKYYLKSLLVLLVIFLMLCLSSCHRAARKKLDKVVPDVDYDFILISRQEIVINGSHYNVEDLAYDILGKKATERPVSINTTTIDGDTNTRIINNYLYFTYIYSSSNCIFPTGRNNRKFNVALFKTNVETAETTMIYDFKKAMPQGKNTEYPSVCYFFDDKSFIFEYNGNLMVFDISSETVTQTFQFYDAERAVREDFMMISTDYGTFGDQHYYDGNNTVRYAEFKDDKFIDHTFNIEEEIVFDTNYKGIREYYYHAIKRIDKYVYTSRYRNGELTYFNCFDLETDQDLGGEFIENYLQEKKEQEDNEKKEQSTDDDRRRITVNGKDYYYYHGNNAVEIEDKEGNTIYSVSSGYAERNNKKFIELFCAYFDVADGGVIANTTGVYQFNNRLFISFDRHLFPLGRTASMIFELDLESGNLSYLTYTFNNFYIHSITPKTSQ